MDDEVDLVQSGAILRHIARKHGLYGISRAEEARVDEASCIRGERLQWPLWLSSAVPAALPGRYPAREHACAPGRTTPACPTFCLQVIEGADNLATTLFSEGLSKVGRAEKQDRCTAQQRGVLLMGLYRSDSCTAKASAMCVGTAGGVEVRCGYGTQAVAIWCLLLTLLGTVTQPYSPLRCPAPMHAHNMPLPGARRPCRPA